MSEVKKSSSNTRFRSIWVALFVFVISLGVLYSFVQPLGVSPDEAAHMKYVKFLALEGRLPVWQLEGGGEAGYEAQHPPLYYALGAVVYRATGGLSENWRWQAVRWYSLLIGIVLLFVAKGFFIDYFRGRFSLIGPAFVALACTPLLLEYASYINPDIMSVLWCSVILWMCVRVSRGEATKRDRVVLSLALGLGLLTKMTVLGTLPIIVLAYFLEPIAGTERVWERRRLGVFGTLLGAAAVAGWWYVRSSLMYHTPFVHTLGRFGSGLDLAGMTGLGSHLLQLTLSNTYLTTWVERAWLPSGVLGCASYVMVSLIVAAALIAAIVRAVRRKPDKAQLTLDRAPLICAVFVASLIVFHQMQVWFVDYEFNAGGRYLLNGILAINALIIGSLGGVRGGRLWSVAWAAILLVMSGVSIWYMISSVNSSVVPGWHWMQLTIPYK